MGLNAFFTYTVVFALGYTWQEALAMVFLCGIISIIVTLTKVRTIIIHAIPESLKYDIYDFSYRSSEYKALEGKSFQILIVENTPEYIPFVSRKEGTGIEVDTIYIRRGTSNERANSQELDEMFRKHMQHIYPQTGEPLDLQEHLRQLKILYENIAPTIISYENSPLFESIGWLRNLPSKIWGEKKEEDNPLYPEESYEQFIANMIDKKKNKIERVLDLR